MLNKITLMGRLTKEPELRRTQSGTAVCTFDLAVERDFKDASGNRETDFVTCVAWRSTAEFICAYFHKGDMLAVIGALQSRKWQDKNGNNRVSWEVLGEHAYFCGGRKEASEPQQMQTLGEEDDGELPF